MRNAWKLFTSDMKHLCMNTMSVIIALGLVLLPSIFTWYNVLACWDVFGNTGNLKVAVASVDEGYKSSYMPLEVNIGEKVISSLRANDQIDWVFTDEEDAIDGAKSGKYYAAVVIPKEFSKDMLAFYDKDSQRASIVYYTNEKKNAVSPKITAQGADTISYTINQVFANTVAEVSVSVAQGLSTMLEESDARSSIAGLSQNVRQSGARMSQSADVVDLYVALLDSAEGVALSSADLADSVYENASALYGDSKEGMVAVIGHVDNAIVAYDKAYAEIMEAIESLEKIPGGSDEVVPGSGAVPSDEDIEAARQRLEELQKIAQDATDEQTRQEAEALVEQQERLIAAMEAAQAAGGAGASVDDVINALKEAAAIYEDQVKPQLTELRQQLDALAQDIDKIAGDMATVAAGLPDAVRSVTDKVDGAKQTMTKTAASLRQVSGQMSALSTSIDEALASGDLATLKDLLSTDSAILAKALSAPVSVERHAVFAVDNFGSGMTPLYATLALFVGALLIMVTIKPQPSARAIADLGRHARPKPRHLFFGRFGVVSVLAFGQAMVLALGNMFFLGVQVVHPLLFLLCYWVVGQVFAFIMYTLVVSFANLGKAAGVLLLIVQVTACGGSFPLQILPDFVQAISPWVPATHVVNAMRAAMMGVYQGDFWIEMGILLLFVVPFLILGLFLRKPMAKFMHWYIEQVEASGLMS